MFNPQLYPGTKRQIELSQEELGHIVGASRQRIGQALQALEKAGLITVDYRMITVLDIEGLRRFGD
jgi:DNA-binding GntR family transcriptional regulator